MPDLPGGGWRGRPIWCRSLWSVASWRARSSGRMLQRAPHHGAHQVASVFGVGLVILERVDNGGSGFGGGAENGVTRRLAGERGLGLRDAPRRGLGAADADARIADFAALQAIGGKRRGHGEIAGAAVEFVEAEFGVAREEWQPRFRQQFILGECGRHDAGKEILRWDRALA